MNCVPRVMELELASFPQISSIINVRGYISWGQANEPNEGVQIPIENVIIFTFLLRSKCTNS